MKYVNGQTILPEEVLKLLQEYAEGELIYIPKRPQSHKQWGEISGGRQELLKRNKAICHAFMALWEIMSQHCPQFQLQIVTIEDDERRTELLDTAYDFLISPYDQGYSQAHTFLPVGAYRFCIAMPRSHPLAKAKQISLQDLEGGPLLVMRPGNSEINDQIRRDIQKEHSSIAILDIAPQYSLQTFNQCMESGVPLLSLECWRDVHPGLATIPLAESYTLPYGVVAAIQPPGNTASFLAQLKKLLCQEKKCP